MSFTLEADTSFRANDKFLWKFSSRFLYKEGARRAVAGLTIRYDNDSVTGKTQRISTSGNVEITVEADDNSTIREVTGFIYLDEGDMKSRKMLFIDNPSLIRFHQKAADEVVVADTTEVVEIGRAHV